MHARRHAIEQLTKQLRGLERGGGTKSRDGPWRSTGIAALDALLPPTGQREGLLLEWLSPAEGSGAGTLAILSAVGLTTTHKSLSSVAIQNSQSNHFHDSHQRPLVIIDPYRQWYPPAAVRCGVNLRRTVVVRPAQEKDVFWTLEQSLRCSGVAATVCWLQQIDERIFRRLQLAAEKGGGVGFLCRSTKFLHQPSWADARFQLHPLSGTSTSRRWILERLHCRGAGLARSIQLEMNDETGAVRLVTELASAKVVSRAAGA